MKMSSASEIVLVSHEHVTAEMSLGDIELYSHDHVETPTLIRCRCWLHKVDLSGSLVCLILWVLSFLARSFCNSF